MSETLWRIDELLAATQGTKEGSEAGPINGISIDTRTIEQGDLFVALKDVRDGHDFVTMAFGKGAAAALVSNDYKKKDGDGLLIRVDDPLAALERLAVAARARLKAEAQVVAVTGSAGKTTSKEILRAMFAAIGKVHASEKSYNNHWGVPLTLARMPADTDFAVIEIGMNHPGEIRPLSKLARPHVALITTVAPAHLGQFRDVAEIAEAKAEIFEGVEPEGVIVLPGDNEHYYLLACRAFKTAPGRVVVSFGCDETAVMRLEEKTLELTPGGSRGTIVSGPFELSFELPLPGRHNALNLAGCVTALWAAGSDVERSLNMAEAGLQAVATLRLDPAGRGQVFELGGITLIDESYNANPASMRAALATLALYPRERRRIAVLGDMLELGSASASIHADLAEAVAAAGVDRLFACGPEMRHLFDALEAARRGDYAADAAALQPLLIKALMPGDVVMVKASNGSKLGPLVKAVRDALATKAAE